MNIVAELPSQQTLAFRKAMMNDSKHVDSLRLEFLRCDLFDCLKASKRMILHFDYKMELFGEDYLVRNIQYQDLSDEEHDILQHGFVHLLPSKDRAGRTVIMFNGNVNQLFSNERSVFRCLFWFTMAILHADVDTQTKGIASIYWSIGQTKLVSMDRLRGFKKWGSHMPVRQVSHHVCMDGANTLFQEFLTNLLKTVNENSKVARCRFHVGTTIECLYNLMTFGIPREALPVTEFGFVDLSTNRKMLNLLAKREIQPQPSLMETTAIVLDESERSSSEVLSSLQETTEVANNKTDILIPNNMDVVIGKRGHQPGPKRPGLLRMHHLILAYQEQYEATSRTKKLEVAKLVLKEMKRSGSRFLLPLDTKTDTPASANKKGNRRDRGGDSTNNLNGYVECDEKMALEKISHGFRNLRMKKNKNKVASASNVDRNKSSSVTCPSPSMTTLAETESSSSQKRSRLEQDDDAAISTSNNKGTKHQRS